MSDDIVGYTVKEILVRLDSKLDVIDAKLETKADRERVHQIANTVGALDARVQVLDKTVVKKDGPEMRRLRTLEESNAEAGGERDYRRFLWPAIASLMGASSWVLVLFEHKP